MLANLGNHMQVGIVDTPLTQALENGDNKMAERIIADTNDPTVLNEGPYHRTPLMLVISGDSEMRQHPRNFKIARLLAQKGADVNMRIPSLEFDGASSSPFEELVTFYLTLRTHCSGEAIDLLSVSNLNAVGLNGEENLDMMERCDQAMQLIDIFLGFGGNPNGSTTLGNATLLHMVLADVNPDIELVKKLIDAGGDVKVTNVHGTTPVMDLVLCAHSDVALEILQFLSNNNRSEKPSFESQNCLQEDAFWRSMFAGHSEVAIWLASKGAPCSRGATVNVRALNIASICSFFDLRALPGYFSPLLHDSRLAVEFHSVSPVDKDTYTDFVNLPLKIHKAMIDKIINSCISPVIDAGYPSASESQSDVQNLLERTPFAHLASPDRVSKDSVLQLMFGRLTAGLQQLCVRTIFNAVFFEESVDASLQQLKQLGGIRKDMNYLKEMDKYSVKDASHLKIAFSVTETHISELLKKLDLPQSFSTMFELEAARSQIGCALHLFSSNECFQNCEGDSDMSADEEDTDDDMSDMYDVFMGPRSIIDMLADSPDISGESWYENSSEDEELSSSKDTNEPEEFGNSTDSGGNESFQEEIAGETSTSDKTEGKSSPSSEVPPRNHNDYKAFHNESCDTTPDSSKTLESDVADL